jgi:hypothetical protein
MIWREISMTNAPVEPKVKAGAGGAVVAALIALIIMHYIPWLNGSGELLAYAIGAIIAGGGSLLAGYQARHVARPTDVPPVP